MVPTNHALNLAIENPTWTQSVPPAVAGGSASHSMNIRSVRADPPATAGGTDRIQQCAL